MIGRLLRNVKVVALGHADIPIFSSDVESVIKPPLTNNEDKAGVNLHPFISGAPIQDATAWYWNYLDQSVKPAVAARSTNPIDIWITEIGWPILPATANVNTSIPSIVNL
ncbi:hypothetical protein BGZ96_003581 [Linnemannia gamsii]|uniref:Glycoside hydrolase n=1 Tax=Linnemannia gamsii TaxID=64522 RepID=A0ABQ7JJ03_9FUNG|nr:hypothetical protein BGZ96_003581 [Linnemannia gamsii]